MRTSQPIHSSECLSNMLADLKLEKRYWQTLAIIEWEKMAGAPVISRTTHIYFKEDVLHMVIESAPLRHQLTQSKAIIIKNLNEALKRSVVSDIIFY